jgi:hypothetical protein
MKKTLLMILLVFALNSSASLEQIALSLYCQSNAKSLVAISDIKPISVNEGSATPIQFFLDSKGNHFELNKKLYVDFLDPSDEKYYKGKSVGSLMRLTTTEKLMRGGSTIEEFQITKVIHKKNHSTIIASSLQAKKSGLMLKPEFYTFEVINPSKESNYVEMIISTQEYKLKSYVLKKQTIYR